MEVIINSYFCNFNETFYQTASVGVVVTRSVEKNYFTQIKKTRD